MNNLIISLGRVNKLENEDIYLLMAWCEVGVSEPEIAKAPVKEQIEWVVETIKRYKKQYYLYRKESEGNNFTFIEFLAMELDKPLRWIIAIKQKMEEFYGNTGIEIS